MLERLKLFSVIRPLSNGRIKPCLGFAQDESGVDHEIVLKWRCGPETTDFREVCELISSLLAKDLGLPCPKPVLVEVEANFYQAVPWPALV